MTVTIDRPEAPGALGPVASPVVHRLVRAAFLATGDGPPSTVQAFSWLIRERQYQLDKFGVELDDAHAMQAANGDWDYWDQQFATYFGRVQQLGLSTPAGQQALAKLVATMCGFLEAVVRVVGDLPEPGYSSGEIHWRNEA